jgi:hypothetical protein
MTSPRPGPGERPHPVLSIKGHEFGLKLAPKDREAPIAFLKTL